MRHFLFAMCIVLLLPLAAHAAALSLIGSDSAHVGSEVGIDVVLDADGESINSVEGSISYPPELLSFSGYQDATGVVKLWIAPPQAKTPGVVTFGGGVPGGVDGTYAGGQKSSSITIVRLLFVPRSAGDAQLRVDRSLVLINDGKASELAHTRAGTTLAISAQAEGAAPERSPVVTPPLPFTLTFIPENEGGEAPAMVAFSAFDERGISGYEMKLGWGAWRPATSPAPIPNRWFSYTVKVRAHDSTGGERIAALRVKGLFPTSALVIVLVIVLGSVWKLFMIKKKV